MPDLAFLTRTPQKRTRRLATGKGKNRCVHHEREFLRRCARSDEAVLWCVSGIVLVRQLTKLCNISTPPNVIMFRIKYQREEDSESWNVL